MPPPGKGVLDISLGVGGGVARLLIPLPCLKHLTRNHTPCKTIINIETLSYLLHWQSRNYLKRYAV